MGLTEEPVSRKGNKRVPVAEYVPDDDKEWLQSRRIELNVMITSQFIDWLSAKVADHYGDEVYKVIPPANVVKKRLEQEARAELKRRITERVLAEADIDGRIAVAFKEVQPAL